MNTPPKAVSMKSINGFDINSRHSVDIKTVNKSSKKQSGNKSAFENKIRKFMEKSDNDR